MGLPDPTIRSVIVWIDFQIVQSHAAFVVGRCLVFQDSWGDVSVPPSGTGISSTLPVDLAGGFSPHCTNPPQLCIVFRNRTWESSLLFLSFPAG